tara:strand:- start:5824 stop:6288 length:465 start_codon:yes stop_codon:yes gene_type:complete
MQTQQKLFSRKHRDKYETARDIYNNIKKAVLVKGEWLKGQKKFRKKQLDYKTYYSVIKKFFEILARDLVQKNELIHLPGDMGYLYLDKKQHKRAFHYRVDINESNNKGELVKYKVPILDDYYYKVVWKRPKKYSKCKIMPLGIFKEKIKKLKTT